MPGKRKEQTLPDFGQRVLGDNPTQTMRIMALIRAGHAYDYILRVGHYQQSWGPLDIQRVLRDHKQVIPDAPDPLPHSKKLTSVTTVGYTPRQAEAVHHLCQGHTDDQIAEAMGVGTTQVRKFLARAVRLAGAHSRVQLVAHILSGKLVPVVNVDPDDE
jgi:DNA-binding NarL/FixJ family response regulator